jgi:hypothetical protein
MFCQISTNRYLCKMHKSGFNAFQYMYICILYPWILEDMIITSYAYTCVKIFNLVRYQCVICCSIEINPAT